MGTAVTTQEPTPPSQHADQTRKLPPALQPAHFHPASIFLSTRCLHVQANPPETDSPATDAVCRPAHCCQEMLSPHARPCKPQGSLLHTPAAVTTQARQGPHKGTAERISRHKLPRPARCPQRHAGKLLPRLYYTSACCRGAGSQSRLQRRRHAAAVLLHLAATGCGVAAPVVGRPAATLKAS